MADRPIVVNVDANVDGLKRGMGEATDHLKKFEGEAADTGTDAGRKLGDEFESSVRGDEARWTKLGRDLGDAIAGGIAAVVAQAITDAIASAARRNEDDALYASQNTPAEAVADAKLPGWAAELGITAGEFQGFTAEQVYGQPGPFTASIQQRIGQAAKSPGEVWQLGAGWIGANTGPVGDLLGLVPVIGGSFTGEGSTVNKATYEFERLIDTLSRVNAAAASIGSAAPVPQPNGAAAPSSSLPWATGWAGAHTTGTAAIG